MLIVGLAPAAYGGNRTGRVFTGDSSGDFLYAALYGAGFANQPTAQRQDDGLALTDVYIAAAARCAPPDNKPTPEELNTCRPYLVEEIALLGRLQVIVALGRIVRRGAARVPGIAGVRGPGRAAALRSCRSCAARRGACTQGGCRPSSPYHPSRQNTQTGRLTAEMPDRVWTTVRELVAR